MTIADGGRCIVEKKARLLVVLLERGGEAGEESDREMVVKCVRDLTTDPTTLKAEPSRENGGNDLPILNVGHGDIL